MHSGGCLEMMRGANCVIAVPHYTHENKLGDRWSTDPKLWEGDQV